jgi:hypothetical protein
VANYRDFDHLHHFELTWALGLAEGTESEESLSEWCQMSITTRVDHPVVHIAILRESGGSGMNRSEGLFALPTRLVFVFS